MTRVVIELTESERQRLAALARKTGKSESLVVREALQKHLRQIQTAEDADDPLRAAFGLWKDLNIDGLEYQRNIRAEWNRDREQS